MTKKTIQVVILVVIIFLIAAGVFFFDDIVKILNKNNNETVINDNDLKIEDNKISDLDDGKYNDEIVKLSLDQDVIKKINNNTFTKEDFLKGFWYESNGNLTFFDPKELLKAGYSIEEIKAIILSLKKVKFYKKHQMEIVPDDELDSDTKFYNSLVNSSKYVNNNFLKTKESLENKKNKTAEDYNRLAGIYSLQGKYKESNESQKKACKMDKKYCNSLKVKLIGKVVDENEKPVKGVEVKLLSTNEKVLTNEKGEYSFEVSLVKLRKDRLSFEKKGYSNNFLGILLNSDNRKEIKNKTVKLVKSDRTYVLDLKNKKIDNGGEFKDGQFVLKNDNSKYYIKPDVFVDNKGKKYLGKVYATLFYFDNNTAPQGLLELDSFSQDDNFLGTSMESYGMPYIIFKDKNGKRLEVKKDKPVILEAAFDWLKKIMSSDKSIAKQEKEKILAQSKKGEMYYTLERIERLNYDLIPYWVLDQKSGVWNNVGYDILDPEKGMIRTVFYTIN